MACHSAKSSLIEALLADRNYFLVYQYTPKFNASSTTLWPERVGRPPCWRWQTVESFGSTAHFLPSKFPREILTAPRLNLSPGRLTTIRAALRPRGVMRVLLHISHLIWFLR